MIRLSILLIVLSLSGCGKIRMPRGWVCVRVYAEYSDGPNSTTTIIKTLKNDLGAKKFLSSLPDKGLVRASITGGV